MVDACALLQENKNSPSIKLQITAESATLDPVVKAFMLTQDTKDKPIIARNLAMLSLPSEERTVYRFLSVSCWA